eukprot:Gb_01522 [translate_table: standard]
MGSWSTTCKWIRIASLLFMHQLLMAVIDLIDVPHWLLGSKILKVSVGSHLAFTSVKRVLPYAHWFFSFVLHLTRIRGFLRLVHVVYGSLFLCYSAGWEGDWRLVWWSPWIRSDESFRQFLDRVGVDVKNQGFSISLSRGLRSLPIIALGNFFSHLVIGLQSTSGIPVLASLRPNVSKGCALSYLVFEVGFALLTFTVCSA